MTEFDERDARDWLASHFDEKVIEFGLSDWLIRWEDVEFEKDWKLGEVDVQPDYHRAVIRLDCRRFVDASHVERAVEHELIHVCAYNTYDTAWRLVSASSMPAAEQDIVKEALHSAIERDCRQLESLVKSLRNQ